MDAFLKSKIKTAKSSGLYRKRNTFAGSKPNISFISNDYLGLSKHPGVIAAYNRGLNKYGASLCSAQLLGGYTKEHQYLEEELAAFLGYESVILFSTGYMANLGLITSLFDKNNTYLFVDRLSHASIMDGCLYSGISFKRYKHLDIKNLEFNLEKKEAKYKAIITEGVFSMDGDIAKLADLVRVAYSNRASLILDDAHALGVLGKRGGGTLEHYNVPAKNVQILVGTFGKAFGTFGAFVASSQEIIENLVQFARPYIYTTALPAAIVGATRASLSILKNAQHKREYLCSLIDRFKDGAQQLDLPLLASDTPIQPLLIGDVKEACSIHELLKMLGIVAGLIRPPTVAPGTSRLRITITATHTEENIDMLLEALGKAILKTGTLNVH